MAHGGGGAAAARPQSERGYHPWGAAARTLTGVPGRAPGDVRLAAPAAGAAHKLADRLRARVAAAAVEVRCVQRERKALVEGLACRAGAVGGCRLRGRRRHMACGSSGGPSGSLSARRRRRPRAGAPVPPAGPYASFTACNTLPGAMDRRAAPRSEGLPVHRGSGRLRPFPQRDALGLIPPHPFSCNGSHLHVGPRGGRSAAAMRGSPPGPGLGGRTVGVAGEMAAVQRVLGLMNAVGKGARGDRARTGSWDGRCRVRHAAEECSPCSVPQSASRRL
jgi:hypothetical protein